MAVRFFVALNPTILRALASVTASRGFYRESPQATTEGDLRKPARQLPETKPGQGEFTVPRHRLVPSTRVRLQTTGRLTVQATFGHSSSQRSKIPSIFLDRCIYSS